MNYYWVEGKKDYKKLSSLFVANGIEYSIRTKKVLLNNQTEKVYVFLVDDKINQNVDELIESEENIYIENCFSKHITFQNIKQKKKLKEILQIIGSCMLAIIFLFFPIGMIENNIVGIILTILKLGLIIGSIVYTAKKEATAIVTLLGIEMLISYLYSSMFFDKYSFEIIDDLKILPRYYMFFYILVMIITLVIGIFYGLKKYNRNLLLGKLKFAFLIIFGYFIIMITTIEGYANLFENYHNELYWKYQEKLLTVSYSVNLDSSVCIKELEIETDAGYEKIQGFYNKEYGSENVDISPYRISIDIYDTSNNFIKSYTIKPAINTIIEESNSAGTADASIYRYFSYVTYFTIGYGDIYPIANVMKNWVIQEAIIANIMSLLIVPLLLIAGQIFIVASKNDK